MLTCQCTTEHAHLCRTMHSIILDSDETHMGNTAGTKLRACHTLVKLPECSGDHRSYPQTTPTLIYALRPYTLIVTPPLPLAPQNSERPHLPYLPPAPVSSSSRSSNYRLSCKLETEANVILALLTKLIIGETDPSELRPGWIRVLVMGIMRG